MTHPSLLCLCRDETPWSSISSSRNVFYDNEMALGCFSKVGEWSYQRTVFQLQHVVDGGQVNWSTEVRLTVSFHPPIIYREHYYGTCILQSPNPAGAFWRFVNDLYCARPFVIFLKASTIKRLHLRWSGFLLWSSQLQDTSDVLPLAMNPLVVS